MANLLLHFRQCVTEFPLSRQEGGGGEVVEKNLHVIIANGLEWDWENENHFVKEGILVFTSLFDACINVGGIKWESNHNILTLTMPLPPLSLTLIFFFRRSFVQSRKFSWRWKWFSWNQVPLFSPTLSLSLFLSLSLSHTHTRPKFEIFDKEIWLEIDNKNFKGKWKVSFLGHTLLQNCSFAQIF